MRLALFILYSYLKHGVEGGGGEEEEEVGDNEDGRNNGEWTSEGVLLPCDGGGMGAPSCCFAGSAAGQRWFGTALYLYQAFQWPGPSEGETP